jgi:pimeloyl-ACP methyl ester carboxylesterase
LPEPFESAFEPWEVELHGHRAVYHAAGSGPPVVLIHGMVNSSRHWREVAVRLADRHTVIAPDLIGHGDSATPRGTTRSAPTRRPSATSWSRSGSDRRPWSATRSAAA